ncbi:hypothetical protein [Deinococcus puniceus]|nr:hypothetical protein [Deinococcus puniceus]
MTLNACAMTLLLAGAGLASGQSRVLFDNRLPAPEPRITESERGRIEYLAEQAAQLGSWDEEDFRPSEYCDGKDFAINGVAPGAFTAKGVQQTAYLYTYCYFRPGWKQGLVILQKNEIVAHYVFTALSHNLYAVKDINQNGFTELAFEGGFTGQGYTSGYVEVAELKPQRRYMATFNYNTKQQVYEDNCGAVESGGTWQSLVIRVTPAPTPKYTAQTISGSCEQQRVATKVGSIRPITVKAAPTGWTPAPLK